MIKCTLILLVCLGLAPLAQAESIAGVLNAARPEIVSLWPNAMPGGADPMPRMQVSERAKAGELSDRYAEGIGSPDLALFPAAEPGGQAMLIIPGGGYTRVVMDKEGYETASWFAKRGISAFVLRYRLPGEGWQPRQWVGLQDAQRAMRWIRAHADRFAIDPEYVGVMGFSAGGHLAGLLSTDYSREVYSPVDAIDELDAHPAFTVLVYPVISMDVGVTHLGSRERLLGEAPSEDLVQAMSIDQRVHSGMAPLFLLHAEDDEAVAVGNSWRLHQALRREGVAVDGHYYSQGGHGFGLRYANELPVGRWPELAAAWILEVAAGAGLDH